MSGSVEQEEKLDEILKVDILNMEGLICHRIKHRTDPEYLFFTHIKKLKVLLRKKNADVTTLVLGFPDAKLIQQLMYFL